MSRYKHLSFIKYDFLPLIYCHYQCSIEHVMLITQRQHKQAAAKCCCQSAPTVLAQQQQQHISKQYTHNARGILY